MADSQVLKALSPDNPLCGISTYKDTLNLATGACTRQIYKLVLHGTESYGKNVTGTYQYYMAVNPLHKKVPICVCSHLPSVDDYPADVIGVHTTRWANNAVYLNFGEDVMLAQPSGNTVDGLKEYITAQYNAGTPVTIWYIMQTATTETITVPSGLSGTEEGYLTQTGTPSPSAPIYPTANTVNVWVHSLWEMKSATETITSGQTIYANGTPITTYNIKGNTVQSGTPTPSNPITISGVGNKTANLLNVTSDTSVFLNLGSGSGYEYTINADKTITNPEGKAFYGGFRIKVEPNTTYTCHCVASYNGQMRLAEYSDIITDITTNRIQTTINVTIKQPGQGYGTVSFTTTAETKWVLLYWYIDGAYSPNTLSDLMFLEGEYDRYTIPDYIPYGYKIPISSGQTVNNYLGSIQSTRQIKKLVLTGEETVAGSAVTGGWIITQLSDSINNTAGVQTAYCSHYKAKENGAMSGLSNGEMCISTQYNNRVNFVTSFSSATDFQAYLAQQYANGTPVTVWYVLATAETGIVNEPLMKIGDYADSISNATAIPTVDGANSITVDTTVQPSEFSATWTGWHDSSVKEWDGSQWNE